MTNNLTLNAEVRIKKGIHILEDPTQFAVDLERKQGNPEIFEKYRTVTLRKGEYFRISRNLITTLTKYKHLVISMIPVEIDDLGYFKVKWQLLEEFIEIMNVNNYYIHIKVTF